jgi:hypothetical protein
MLKWGLPSLHTLSYYFEGNVGLFFFIVPNPGNILKNAAYSSFFF